MQHGRAKSYPYPRSHCLRQQQGLRDVQQQVQHLHLIHLQGWGVLLVCGVVGETAGVLQVLHDKVVLRVHRGAGAGRVARKIGQDLFYDNTHTRARAHTQTEREREVNPYVCFPYSSISRSPRLKWSSSPLNVHFLRTLVTSASVQLILATSVAKGKAEMAVRYDSRMSWCGDSFSLLWSNGDFRHIVTAGKSILRWRFTSMVVTWL